MYFFFLVWVVVGNVCVLHVCCMWWCLCVACGGVCGGVCVFCGVCVHSLGSALCGTLVHWCIGGGWFPLCTLCFLFFLTQLQHIVVFFFLLLSSRPFGVAVFNLNINYDNLEKDDWSPPPLNIYTMKNHDRLETHFHLLHCEIIDQNMELLELASRSRGIVVGLQMLTGRAHRTTALVDTTTTVASAATTSTATATSSAAAAAAAATALASVIVAKGHHTPRSCLSSLVDPTDFRDDLFVSLVDGVFNKDGKRSHKNVKITMHALLDDGTEVKCLQRGNDHCKSSSFHNPMADRRHSSTSSPSSTSSTSGLQSSYTSTVLYHNGNPHYNETVRIALDVEQAKNAHLVFVFSHISSKKSKTSVFGFSFLPLRDLARKRRSQFQTLGGSVAALLPDGMHMLQTYAPVIGISKLLTPGHKGKVLRPLTSYLDDSGRNKPMLRKDTFRVQTRLCSNQTSRDKNLRDLMRLDLSTVDESGTDGTVYTTASVVAMVGLDTAENLIQILDNITFVNVTDVALYLREIFDRLFLLLPLFDKNSPMQQEVFCVLIQCIGRLTGSRSNIKHREVLDIYIQECFQTRNIGLYQIIINQATNLMQWLDDTTTDAPTLLNATKQRRTISAMMRCFEYVVKVAIAAGLKAHEVAKETGVSEALSITFKQSLEQLMYYADALMKKST